MGVKAIYKSKDCFSYNLSQNFFFRIFCYLSLNVELLLYKSTFFLFTYNKNKFNEFSYSFYLPNFFFVKETFNLIKIIFIQKLYYFSFLKNFFFNYLYSKSIYFFRLKLKGLGFFVKRLSKSFLCFFLALNHYFYFNVAQFVYLKKKKRHFMFISYNKDKLNLIF